MPYKIIIHDGKAHLDELIGSALLSLHLGSEPDSIERIDSRDAEKRVNETPLPGDTYFIDCGMVFDPDRKLFDHHQDKGLDSSALLIFNQFFPHLVDTDLHNFIRLVSKVDTCGAMSLNDFHLMGESKEYFAFSHKILLKTFEDEPGLILKIFMAGLDDKIKFERAKKEAALWLEEPGHIAISQNTGLNIIQYMVKPPSELVSPMRSAITSVVEDNDISAILSFDEKQTDARTFYRTDYGHNHVDFSLSTPSETLFCHPGGFLMKFIPEDSEEWKRLIEESVIR
ncbi:MAG: MYG1 family protein [Spirochaetales bacterium]|nr:MYG1 family protein [Spirochaetales bacterium]